MRTFVKHMYDVDLREIKKMLQQLRSDHPKPGVRSKAGILLESLDIQIEILQKRTKFDKEEFDNRVPYLVVPSDAASFLSGFALLLALCDLSKLELYLDHHMKYFTANYYAPNNDFITFIEVSILDKVAKMSLVDMVKRKDRIIGWIRESKKRPVLKKTPLIEWIGDSNLKSFSKKLQNNQCTNNPLDFHNALQDCKKTTWKLSYEILALLIYKLDRKKMICSPKRGHFKAAKQLFVDLSIEANQQKRLSELSSRINKSPKRYQKEIRFVDKLVYNL